MIKVDGNNVAVEGKGIDILAEICVLIYNVSKECDVPIKYILARLALALIDDINEEA